LNSSILLMLAAFSLLLKRSRYPPGSVFLSSPQSSMPLDPIHCCRLTSLTLCPVIPPYFYQASLLDDTISIGQEDPTSAIFSILKDYSQQHRVMQVTQRGSESKRLFSIVLGFFADSTSVLIPITNSLSSSTGTLFHRRSLGRAEGIFGTAISHHSD
jgi:hypothetical protein